MSSHSLHRAGCLLVIHWSGKSRNCFPTLAYISRKLIFSRILGWLILMAVDSMTILLMVVTWFTLVSWYMVFPLLKIKKVYLNINFASYRILPIWMNVTITYSYITCKFRNVAQKFVVCRTTIFFGIRQLINFRIFFGIKGDNYSLYHKT